MRRIGPYELVRELGRGGMGVVHEVRDPTGRRLALKLILEVSQGEALTRFRREAELMARVKHPNVVRVHALDVAPEGPFIVTELVDGRSLSQVAREGPLAPEQAAQLVRTLADAVEALHAHGILHRDLKPQNVIVRPDDSPVVLDFGLARDLVSKERLTVTGALMGTPVYMAPEQAEGAKPSTLGPTVDVYALGAVLLETLTGMPPFDESQGAMVTIKRVLMDEPRWPSAVRPGFPHALEAICRLAMSKAPTDRYPTAAALRDDLDRFLRGDPPHALARFPAPRSGARMIVAAGAAALVCALGTVGLVLYAVRAGAQAEVVTVAPVATARVAETPPPTEPTPPRTPTIPPSLEGGLVLTHDEGAAAVGGFFVDATTVVTFGREDGSVRVWSLVGDAASLRAQVMLPGERRSLDAALHGDALLVRTPFEVLRVELATLKIVERWTLPGEPAWRHYEDRRPLAVTGDTVFVPTERGGVHLLDARTLEPREGPALEAPGHLEAHFVSAAARGKWVVAGAGQATMSPEDKATPVPGDDRDEDAVSGHGELHLWDVTTGVRRFSRFTLPTAVLTVALDAHDPPRVAFGLYSGVVGLWDSETGEDERLAGTAAVLPTTSETAELAAFSEAVSHSGYVYGVAFAPDGRLFSTSCGYGLNDPWNELRVWSPDGKHVGRLDKVLHCPRALAFSPDGTRVLVGTWTLSDAWKGVEVWDVKTLEARLNRE